MSALPDEFCGCQLPHLCSYHEGYRDALDAVATDPDASLDHVCRCGRPLDCVGCDHAPEDCDCSHVEDEILAELVDDDPGTDDPLALALMGLPSGIRCHGGGRCLSGHCAGGGS